MEQVKLTDICKPKQWKTIPTNDLLKNGFPVYGANGVIGYYKEYNHKDSVVTITCRGATCGTVNITEPKSYITGNAMCLDNLRQDIMQKYLYYYLSNYDFTNVISGSAQPQITRQGLEKVVISIETKEEQTTIVALLDKVNSIIDARQQQLAKLDELVKARFVEMFGDININDKGWDVEPLGRLCTIVRGASPRPIEKYLGGDVPWIKISDATHGENIYLNKTKEYIIQEGVSKSRKVKSGSLIFANCGVSLGFARIITFDGCIHDGWLAMEDVDDRANKIFLLQALNQMTEHFREIAPAGTQPNLNTTIMKEYKQIIPPMCLQEEFVEFIDRVDKLRLQIEKSLEKLETLKKALMQKYFG